MENGPQRLGARVVVSLVSWGEKALSGEVLGEIQKLF